jgi:hypothetical protein
MEDERNYRGSDSYTNYGPTGFGQAGSNKNPMTAFGQTSMSTKPRTKASDTSKMNKIYKPKASPGPIASSANVREGRSTAMKQQKLQVPRGASSSTLNLYGAAKTEKRPKAESFTDKSRALRTKRGN